MNTEQLLKENPQYRLDQIKAGWLCPPDNRLIPYLVRSICIMWEARGFV